MKQPDQHAQHQSCTGRVFARAGRAVQQLLHIHPPYIAPGKRCLCGQHNGWTGLSLSLQEQLMPRALCTDPQRIGALLFVRFSTTAPGAFLMSLISDVSDNWYFALVSLLFGGIITINECCYRKDIAACKTMTCVCLWDALLKPKTSWWDPSQDAGQYFQRP